MSEAETGAPPPGDARPEPGRRRMLPLALIVVATLLTFLAIFALWANRQLLNTDNWTDSSSALLEEEAVREQLAIYLVDQLYANVDVEAQVREALPPRAQGLAGPAAGGLRDVAVEATERLLARPRVQELWEEANRRAHTRFLQIVEGEGGEIASTEGGAVTIDLRALLGETQERFDVGGRAQGALPSGAAELTLIESDQLGTAQDLADLLKALAIVLLVLALGLYALAIYLARGWRREALRATGFGFILAGLAALAARSLAGDALVESLAKTEAVVPAVDATWETATSLLQEAAAAALAYGVVMVVAAWLAGPTGWAVATRRALAPYLREPRYAYGALAVLLLVLLAWGPTPATRRPLGALLLAGLLALGVELLRRQTAREFPEANIDDAMERWRERIARATRPGRRGGAAEGGDRLGELERLARLRDSGALSASEFEQEKARIIEARAPAGAA